MQLSSMIRQARLCAAVALLAATSAVPVGAQTAPQRFAGDITAVAPGTLSLRVGAETVQLRVPDDVRITARSKADWSAVTNGGYVGTTAVPQADGTLLAKEVHVFTEAQRGTGEGHYPMSTPGDTMTNATVSSMSAARPRDTMTNATVAGNASAGGGHRLTLTYKGGEKTVIVPDGVPIITSEPGDRSLLAPGTHVVAYARRGSDGTLTVERISVGRNGFATPI
jgi:hypothetical protein